MDDNHVVESALSVVMGGDGRFEVCEAKIIKFIRERPRRKNDSQRVYGL